MPQAQIILTSGQAVIANVEKIRVIPATATKPRVIEWTTPDDAYARLVWIDASQVVAVVVVRDTDEVA